MGKGSSILFVSSVGGYNPRPPLGLYGVSKTTLIGLTKALAVELGPKGIRVNCLAPGTIKTRFSSVLWQSKESEAFSSSQTFLGRVGESDEMAGCAAFLVSDDASYVTGETLLATGGMQARL